MNPYTTKLDMQTGTISVYKVGVIGAQEITCPIDEWPALLEVITESGQAEYERAKAIMGNPLLDARAIHDALAHYDAVRVNGGSGESLKPLVEFYQNTLVMLRQLFACLGVIALAINQREHVERYKFEYNQILEWQDKIAAILEAHKQHFPDEKPGCADWSE